MYISTSYFTLHSKSSAYSSTSSSARELLHSDDGDDDAMDPSVAGSLAGGSQVCFRESLFEI